jgi:hypothetical protein
MIRQKIISLPIRTSPCKVGKHVSTQQNQRWIHFTMTIHLHRVKKNKMNEDRMLVGKQHTISVPLQNSIASTGKTCRL